jgi:predicted nucleotidyltransferase
LLRYYERAGNENRLYEEHADLLKTCDYDPELAGAALLGADAAAICSEPAYRAVAALLEDQTTGDEPHDLVLGLRVGIAHGDPGLRSVQMLRAFGLGFLREQ